MAFALSVGLPVGGCAEPDAVGARQVLESLDAMAARRPWPGFDASATPVALYTDQETYLLRHPDPPPGFRQLRRRSDAWVMDSVHPAMRANTVVELGGTLVATASVDPAAGRQPEETARLLLHETFHVFQRQRHPEWAANEADLFTYPVAALDPLRLRRLETATLRRSLLAPDSVRRICWAKGALEVRTRRFAALPPEAAAYERGTEMWEGLARYVEARASSGAPGPAGTGESGPSLPSEGFAPADVRERGYAVGWAMAHLLDAIDPGWQERVEAGDSPDLTAALDEALARHQTRVCNLAPDEQRRARTVAETDIARHREMNRRLLAELETQRGYRVELEAPASAPLWPAAFDPLNVRVLADGVVLHQRWLRLERDGETVEVLGRQALTRSFGEHPLFEGVARLLISGLREPPLVAARGDTTRLRAAGMTATLLGAELERDGPALRVRLREPEPERPD